MGFEMAAAESLSGSFWLYLYVINKPFRNVVQMRRKMEPQLVWRVGPGWGEVVHPSKQTETLFLSIVISQKCCIRMTASGLTTLQFTSRPYKKTFWILYVDGTKNKNWNEKKIATKVLLLQHFQSDLWRFVYGTAELAKDQSKFEIEIMKEFGQFVTFFFVWKKSDHFIYIFSQSNKIIQNFTFPWEHFNISMSNW